MKKHATRKFIIGVSLIILFTQIDWAGFFFSKKDSSREVDNTALFYTESEQAGEVEFDMRKK